MPHDEDCDGCATCFVVHLDDLFCPICATRVAGHDELTAAMHALEMRRRGLVSEKQFLNAVVRASGDAT